MQENITHRKGTTMQEIFPGLYAISRTMCNCFLIESAVGELTLIDTGMPGTTGSILKALASLNYNPEQIKHIFITHSDLDHAGSLAKLVSLTGAKVYAGKESVHYLETGTMPPHVPGFMNVVMGAMQKSATVDEALDDGDVVDVADGILAIHVPGHTPENYNFFWQKHGVLFGADLFFTITGDLTLSPAAISWNTHELKKSAIKAFELAPTYICPGHGNSINLAQSPEKATRLRRQLEGAVTLAAT